MSDLLTRFVTALESIAESLQTAKASKASIPMTPPTKTDTTADDAAAKAAAKKAAAEKAAAEKAAAEKAAAAAAAAANKGAATSAGGKGAAGAPAGTTKAPGGKRSLDDVRAMIRKVATTEGLGKPDAVNILDEEGGVKSVAELKPEHYDSVYEACEVAIANAGKAPAATDETDDLM
jgi:hypothetical protein